MRGFSIAVRWRPLTKTDYIMTAGMHLQSCRISQPAYRLLRVSATGRLNCP